MSQEFPYINLILELMDKSHFSFKRKYSHHIHFGYWQSFSGQNICFEDFDSASNEMSKQLFSMADIRPGQKILDTGCGLGGLMKILDHNYEGLEITGLNVCKRQ